MPCHTDGVIFGVVGLGTDKNTGTQKHAHLTGLDGVLLNLVFYFLVMEFDLRAL
jgi:hypothetical protein